MVVACRTLLAPKGEKLTLRKVLSLVLGSCRNSGNSLSCLVSVSLAVLHSHTHNHTHNHRTNNPQGS